MAASSQLQKRAEFLALLPVVVACLYFAAEERLAKANEYGRLICFFKSIIVFVCMFVCCLQIYYLLVLFLFVC